MSPRTAPASCALRFGKRATPNPTNGPSKSRTKTPTRMAHPACSLSPLKNACTLTTSPLPPMKNKVLDSHPHSSSVTLQISPAAPEFSSAMLGTSRCDVPARVSEGGTSHPSRTQNTKPFWSLALGASLVLGTWSLALPASASDWPCWGGNDPGRNMYSPATGLPDHFDVGKTKPNSDEVDMSTTKNVKWVAQLGSQAFGNVVVSGGKVFIGTNNENPRDPQHVGDRSILLCFDEKTGEFLWQLVVPKLASGKVNDWENLGLLSSPCVEGNRVYIVTSRCEVLCLDTEGMANGNEGPFTDEAQYVVGPGKPKEKMGPKDADIIWRYDMMDELGVFPHNASNCSIIIVGGLVYVCTSNGQDWTHSNIPSPNSPSFIALDKKTGELKGEDAGKIRP